MAESRYFGRNPSLGPPANLIACGWRNSSLKSSGRWLVARARDTPAANLQIAATSFGTESIHPSMGGAAIHNPEQAADRCHCYGHREFGIARYFTNKTIVAREDLPEMNGSHLNKQNRDPDAHL